MGHYGNADAMMATIIMQHMDLLMHFSRVDNDIFITGANLHIVNGDWIHRDDRKPVGSPGPSCAAHTDVFTTKTVVCRVSVRS